jgi:hypothetical protein
MSEVLRGRLGCSVTAIVVSAEAAERARARCDRVVVGDAETLDFDRLFGGEQFDAITATPGGRRSSSSPGRPSGGWTSTSAWHATCAPGTGACSAPSAS